MLHEFLSYVTDDLLSFTEAVTAEEINCEDIVTVVTDKVKSWGLNPKYGENPDMIAMISFILYRIIKKNMRIPKECSKVSDMLDDVGVYMFRLPRIFFTLYNHWRELPLDDNDIRLLKKYFYPKESTNVDGRWAAPMHDNESYFYIGSLGINYETSLEPSGLKKLAAEVIYSSKTYVDEKGVLTINLNNSLLMIPTWYKSLIIDDAQMRDIAKAIWRRVLEYDFGVNSKITSVKINPYDIEPKTIGATKKTMEDNFSIKIAGQSYTISEFIDALTVEFTRLLTSSKSAVIANKRNLTQSKTLR